jgi:small subunit ribosomal protein S20
VAHSLSAQKRIRQNLKHRTRNRARRAALRTQVRKCQEDLASGSSETAPGTFRTAVKALDQAASRGTIHPNTAARKKSRLARRLNALKTGAAPSPAPT